MRRKYVRQTRCGWPKALHWLQNHVLNDCTVNARMVDEARMYAKIRASDTIVVDGVAAAGTQTIRVQAEKTAHVVVMIVNNDRLNGGRIAGPYEEQRVDDFFN